MTKYHRYDLLNSCAIHEEQNADKATTFKILSNEKLSELKVYVTNDFAIISS